MIVPFLVYVIVTFCIAYVWHLKVFDSRYKALKIYRDPVLPQLGLASMVIQGICFALVYNGVFEPMEAGMAAKMMAYFAFGALFSWSFTTLATAAKSPMTSIRDFTVIETAFTIIQWLAVSALTVLLS